VTDGEAIFKESDEHFQVVSAKKFLAITFWRE